MLFSNAQFVHVYTLHYKTRVLAQLEVYTCIHGKL